MIIFLGGSLDCDIECTILYKYHLGLRIYPFGKKKFGFEKLKCIFNFSFHFCQVSQIDLNSMQQHTLSFPKKSIVMCFYSSKTNNGQTPEELYIRNVQM
jgi:hypothetical protein